MLAFKIVTVSKSWYAGSLQINENDVIDSAFQPTHHRLQVDCILSIIVYSGSGP